MLSSYKGQFSKQLSYQLYLAYSLWIKKKKMVLPEVTHYDIDLPFQRIRCKAVGNEEYSAQR